MIKNFKPPFSRFVKKSHKPLQLAIDDAVDDVCADVTIGEAKVGDLAGIRVHKFKFNRQEYLIAYRPPKAGQVADATTVEWLAIDFYQVGLHENFYDALKHYLKSEG
jgi:ParE-like toxin of type II bacterial toxin-antitoxin system